MSSLLHDSSMQVESLTLHKHDEIGSDIGNVDRKSIPNLACAETELQRQFPAVVNYRHGRDGRTADRLVHELHVSGGALRLRTRGEGGGVAGPSHSDVVYESLTTQLRCVKGVTCDAVGPGCGHDLDWAAYSPENDPRRQGAFEDCTAVRGVITGWSRRSRINMLYRLATLDWDQMRGIPEMVTLTYPGEYPTSGRVVKRHMECFRQAWFRKWGAVPVGVWKLEFQRRGAPHLHFYVGRPVGPVAEFRGWLSSTWYAIVASGDLRHLVAGTGLDRQFVSRAKSVRSIAWYFAKHNAKSAKHFQNEVPDGFEDVGRFWGVWMMPARVETVQLAPADFLKARRVLLGLRRSGMRRAARVRRPATVCGDCEHVDCEAWRILARGGNRTAVVRMAPGFQGSWSLVTDPARVAAQMGAWLSGVVVTREDRRARWSAAVGACSLGHISTGSTTKAVLQPV